MVWVDPNLAHDLARQAGLSNVMDRVALQILTAAQREAAKHLETGDYASSLVMERVPGESGVTDRAVAATDPAAVPIEFGHVREDGTVVSGQHIMLRAAHRGA